jgi:hypothetical protein
MLLSTLFNKFWIIVVPKLVKLENNKRNEDREDSYTFKTLGFIFMNYNIVIFGALYDEFLKGNGSREDYEKMN